MSATDRPSLGDIVSAASVALAVVTAWLYAAGWSYTYHYFDRFRIPLLMVDLPAQHYLIYGGLVAWKHRVATILLTVVLIAVAWACVRWAATLGRFGVSAIVVLLTLALFGLGRWGAISAAQADFLAEREGDYPAYPRTALLLKQDAAEAIGSRLADLPTTDCGRLVLFGSNRLFLIRPVKGAAGANLDSFVVPIDQVMAFRITGEYRSCS
jgi:hypothetical protein